MEPIVEIVRLSSHPDWGTLGAVKIQDVPVCLSVEPYWRENKPNVSCIPAGTYKCVRHISPRFGETFIVTNVEGRSHILFHKGNTMSDTKGCIILGESFAINNGKPCITNSQGGFTEFMRWLDIADEFTLRVV
jgi:hypothetical protein